MLMQEKLGAEGAQTLGRGQGWSQEDDVPKMTDGPFGKHNGLEAA